MSPAIEQMLLSSRTKPTVQQKHISFALEYMQDYDVIRAYKATCAVNGDDLADEDARAAGSRLLKSILVQKIIDEETCKIIAEKRLDKSVIIDRLQRVYFEAMRSKDYGAANSALDKLMKHMGMFETHNKKKRYSADEIGAIKQKLEEHMVS